MLQPNFTRAMVLEMLRAAVFKTMNYDYAYKYTENEEDIRASVFRYVRELLDLDPRWRVFLSYSTRDNDQNRSLYKPDMVFLCGEQEHKNIRLEILVEVKNWPTYHSVQRDLVKLLQLRRRFEQDQPDIVFFAIVANHLVTHEQVPEILQRLYSEIPQSDGLHIWFEHHNLLYKGPWDANKNTDPYRAKLRQIEDVDSQL